MLSRISGSVTAATGKAKRTLTGAASSVADAVPLGEEAHWISADTRSVLDSLTTEPRHIADVIMVRTRGVDKTVTVETVPYPSHETKEKLSDLESELPGGWTLVHERRERTPAEKAKKNVALSEAPL
jgi:hypothetical protein